MLGGNKALLATAVLAAAGCAADDGKLNVRAIADPLSAAAKRGSPMLAEGRGALALGNVGTALEAFRRALRQQPDSVEALAGIAACYERMGRYDLSRVNYEAALAIAPNNPILLNSFAASLQLQGRIAEAKALRAEAAQVQAAAAGDSVRSVQNLVAAEPSVPPLLASKLPEADKAVRAPQPPQMPEVRAAAPAPAALPAAPQQQVVHTEVSGNTEWKIEVAKPVRASSAVTVALPAARPTTPPKSVALAPEGASAARSTAPPKSAALAPEAASAPVTEQAPRKRSAVPLAPTPAIPSQAVAVREPVQLRTGPRLQRLSMGEVALLTKDQPAWRTEVVARSRHSVTARFVPLKGGSGGKRTAQFIPLRTAMAANRPNFRLLNAARHQGLAARTRNYLLDRGWRKIAIGDAAQVRSRSVVLYPADRRVLGKRLAAQFGFASEINRGSDEILVLLGRDSTSVSLRRSRG